jgi:hypothetical protein
MMTWNDGLRFSFEMTTMSVHYAKFQSHQHNIMVKHFLFASGIITTTVLCCTYVYHVWYLVPPYGGRVTDDAMATSSTLLISRYNMNGWETQPPSPTKNPERASLYFIHHNSKSLKIQAMKIK